MKKIISTLIILIVTNQITAQDYKFGKVSKDELQEKSYPKDSSANAAYLFKKRKTYIAIFGGSVKLITEVQVRLKIYNQEGFDWATKKINLYGSTKSKRESVSNLKAVTYNLINGVIVKTKLDKKNIFRDEKNLKLTQQKFTMPNVKEGSVLEWMYRIYSPYFYNIDDVIVQYKIPVKKYETKLLLLDWLNFNKRQKGYYPFKIKETVKYNHDFGTNEKVIEIGEENVPALREESYVNNIYNYAAGLKLEVASFIAPELGVYEKYSQTWEDVSKTIARSSEFGGQLKKTSYFKEDLTALRNKYSNKNELMIAIFEFVKYKVKWNNTYGKYSYNGVRDAYKKGEGSVAEINLILVAMLRAADINANPIILSTRSHGVPIFPTLKGFNYVIAGVETENNIILFDATEENSTPNVLPLRDLNWKGRIIRENETSTWVNLIPKPADLNANIQITINKEGEIQGMERTQYKNYEALNFRNKYRKVKDEDIISKIEEDYGNIEISDFKIVNKKNIYKPVIVMYKFFTEEGIDVAGDKMYFTPLLFMAETKNPFKLEKRDYPIDFGVPNSNRKNISITIPDGYVVESIPESFAIGLPDNLGVFKFSVTQVRNKINVISLLKINSPVISATYYAQLKEFFKQMIAKNTEKVVLIKA
jgi:hypothetical protein